MDMRTGWTFAGLENVRSNTFNKMQCRLHPGVRNTSVYDMTIFLDVICSHLDWTDYFFFIVKAGTLTLPFSVLFFALFGLDFALFSRFMGSVGMVCWKL